MKSKVKQWFRWFKPVIPCHSRKWIIHSIFQVQKLRGGRSAIGWQAIAQACQLIGDHLPRGFRL